MSQRRTGALARVIRTVTGASLALAVLCGCSALQIRTEDKDSGPMRIAVQKDAGPEPTSEPTDGAVPEGMSMSTLKLGQTCPVEVSLAISPEWKESGSTEAFHVFSQPSADFKSPVVLVSCSEAFDDSARHVVDSKRKYAFSKQDSDVLAERMGSLDAGSYWSFQGLLGETEILAIGQEPTVMYGIETGYKVNGRLVNISIQMRALESETELAEDFEKMLPTVAIDGETVPSPSFK